MLTISCNGNRGENLTTQEQYNILTRRIRHLDIKIDIINETESVIASFEGIATSGNINISAESTYRRSGNLTMVFDKKYNILPSPTSKIWFNKRCGIYIGLKDFDGKIVWFNMGRFAIRDVEVNLGNADKTLSCVLADYMSFLDGSLSGLLAYKISIPSGEVTVSEAIMSTCSGLVKTSIENIEVDGAPAVVPYDIEKEPNTPIYNLVKELIDLYMGYDFYFDKNGYLIVEKIKDKKNEPIIEFFKDDGLGFTLNSSSKIDFTNVKNAIFIWGKQLDNGLKIHYRYKNKCTVKSYLNLTDLIDIEDGDICYISDDDKSYVWEKANWRLLDFNVIPIFNIESIGEKILSINDDNVFTDPQAKLRCEYELFNTSNFAETVNFSVVPLYHLSVNRKVNLNIGDVLTGDYLITNISVPLDISSPMDISARKIYY